MTLVPYLNFPGNAEEVLNFYKNVLGGEILMLSRYGDAPMPCGDDEKNNIMHARLVFGNNMIMISDKPKNYPHNTEGNITLSIGLDDVAETEKIFNQLSEGGQVLMPLADQFWGAKFGMFKDKYGVSWMVNCGLKK